MDMCAPQDCPGIGRLICVICHCLVIKNFQYLRHTYFSRKFLLLFNLITFTSEVVLILHLFYLHNCRLTLILKLLFRKSTLIKFPRVKRPRFLWPLLRAPVVSTFCWILQQDTLLLRCKISKSLHGNIYNSTINCNITIQSGCLNPSFRRQPFCK